MMKKVALALLGIGIMFVLPIIFQKGGTTARRFTIVVDTPDGPRSGSSVVSFTSSTAPWWFPVQTRNSLSTIGEAVVVEVGSGHYLFMLMRDVRRVRRISDNEHPGFGNFIRPQMVDGKGNMVGPFPLLISFEDVGDPTTGYEVDPTNLSASFGPGYALRSIQVQEVDEPPSFGAVNRFEHLWGGFDEIDRLAFTEGRPK